ncbi:hypothetical protein [Thaumasiovibrio sp. DFM-14]
MKNNQKQIGVRAGEQLVARFKQPNLQAEVVIMPSQLIERESA